PSDLRLRSCLGRRGVTWRTVRERGRSVRLLDHANLAAGGEGRDVTAVLHRSFRELAIAITRDMGLRLCGVDLIVGGDIAKPCRDYTVLEVNAAPRLARFAVLRARPRRIAEQP